MHCQSILTNSKKIEAYTVEFQMNDEGKSHYLEKDKVKIWRKVAVGIKVISS